MSANVLLCRSGNLVSARAEGDVTSAELYQILKSELHYTKRTQNDWRTKQATGQKWKLERQLCVREIQNPHEGAHSVFPAGLLSRVSELLKKRDISWTVEDLRPVLLPDPQLKLMELDKIRGDQMPALATVFSSDMGIVYAPTGVGKTFLICQICRAYPRTRIIVCTYRKDVAGSIIKRLSEHVPFGELGMVGGGKRQPDRVTVSTIDSLAHAHPDKCRLFLYDEVHEAGSDSRAKNISMVRNARMFGFSASPKGRSDGTDLVVESLFGPIIFTVTYQEAEKDGVVATIAVDLVKVEGHRIPYDEDVPQFRYGIWRNSHRNGLVAREASKHALAGKQVLIIVDKIEHALFIRSKYLPEWPIVHGPVTKEQIDTFTALGILPRGKRWFCTPDQREAYRERFECGQMRYAIATGVWSQGVDFRHLDALVRADGKSATIPSTQIPGRLSRGDAGLLIDFNDVFDDRFARRSDARLRAYRGKGWHVNYV